MCLRDMFNVCCQSIKWLWPERAPFLEGPERFSHTKSHTKISKLYMIAKLFYSHFLPYEKRFPSYQKSSLSVYILHELKMVLRA